MESEPVKKVLIVDDSDLVAAMVGQALSEAGFSVVRGANGAEGIELAYREIPDVIVMDAEMPLMQGYLASRLLKSRRGVRDIPIIMHTSMSEDRDKYWALSSGTDEFVPKDFDNIDRLVDRVRALADHWDWDRDAIQEDAARINRDTIFELLGSVLDQQLFQSTVQNLLAEVGRTMDSLSQTARQILELVPKVCESHLSVLLLQYGKRPVAFVLACDRIRPAEVDEFLQVCLGEFFDHFPTLDMASLQVETFSRESCPDPEEKAAMKLNSYTSVSLLGRADATIGSLHLGNSTNNYFSEQLNSHIEMFARTAAMVLDNSILFNRITEMQHRIRTAFTKFVPQEIIDQLIEDSQTDVRTTGEKREVTMLFSDIRQFTVLSENNSAEDVVAFLNRYFDIMVGIIKGHGGTIDKFVGDAILAIFGAPTSYADNTLRAVRAAIDMMAALPRVRTDNLSLPDEGLRIGIGVHEGEAIVGNIGSADKFDYTVIGDTVNLASRLEGLTKYYHETIIVSESVMSRIGDSIPLRELDTVRVQGREDATNIYSVITADNPLDEGYLQEFAKGLKMYRMGNWETASEYFRRALVKKPGDKTVPIFLERCARYTVSPPDAWDGAQLMDSK